MEGVESLPFRYRKIIRKFDSSGDLVKGEMFKTLEAEVDFLNRVLVYMGGKIEERA